METINQTYNISSLSKDEVRAILESLLFSSSVDVCAEFYKENCLLMLDLANKIRKMFPDIILENINIVPIKTETSNTTYHDEHTESIIKTFPEIYHNEI